jgi:hypothetical protein
LILTIIKSPIFAQLWPDYWSEDERAEFASYLAANPEAGVVVRHSAGCRKIRWSRGGTGKSEGVRVVYTLRLASGAVVLLTIYGKSVKETIPADILQQITKELGHASQFS